MISNKNILKIALVTAAAFGLLMTILKLYESYSQGATSPDGDWMLRGYLGFGMLPFFGLALLAENRKKLQKFIFVKIHWQTIYLLTALSFLLVGMTNVSDYSIPEEFWDQAKILGHMIATALVAFFAYLIGWHIFPKGSKKRKIAKVIISIGLLLFGYSVLPESKSFFGDFAIRDGETSISLAILGVLWIIINEQIIKR